MAGNWRKQVSKAAISGDREHVLKLLQESAEPEKVRNLCVPLFGRHKYSKKWKYPLTFEDVVVEGSMSLLDIAAANGWVDVCEELVTKHGCTHETSTVTEILELASSCPFKNKCRYLQRSPLSYAVKEGHVDVVAYLVRTFKLRISDAYVGGVFLTIAIINSRLEMVKYFVSLCEIDASKLSELAGVIQLGYGVYECRSYPVSPFIVACIQCCDDIIKYLVTEGHCDPREECNWICGGYIISPAIAVAFKGNVELVQYVLNVCNVYLFEREYWTPVPRTCVIGDSEVIKFLIINANTESLKWSNVHQLLMMSSVCSGLIDRVIYLHVNGVMYNIICCCMYEISYVDEAAHNGNFDVVKYMLEEITLSRYEYEQVSLFTMYAAASSGHLPLIKYFMEEHSDFIGKKGHHDLQRVVLHVAAGCGHLDVVKYLITRHNLTLNESDNSIQKSELFLSLEAITTTYKIPSSDGGILHVVAEHGHLNVVDYLINKWNHDPNQTNSFSQTPLHFAAFSGHLPVVEHLLSASSRVSRDDDGNTPLHFACWQGHLRIVKCLIERCKLDPTITNRLSQSPLCLAVQGGHLPVVEYLADKVPSIDPEAPMDDKGNTVLHLAVYSGHINMVEYVIDNWMSKPYKINQGSQIPLHVVFSAGYMHVAEYLIKELPGVVTCTDTSVDDKGNTALHIAVEHCSLSRIQYLIKECKLNPYKKNKFSETPLYLAVYNGHLPVVECLFSECPSVIPEAPVDDKGNTALHIAAQHGQVNLVRCLAKACKLDPNQPNQELSTSLHLAVTHNHLPVVRFLLDEILCHASDLNYHQCLRSANRETSRVLITEYNVKSCLSLFGSRSTFDQNDKFLRGIKSSFPVHSFTKVFLLGDPAAGKSTLAKNFRDLASRFLPSFFGEVSGVESHTAGIIPVTIQSRQLGNIVLYDLAGQPEFYSSHMAVLHKLMQECPAVFICVIDLSKLDEEVRKQLRFWFNFIKMRSAADLVRSGSQVMVAGSHADLLSSDDYAQKQCLVETVSRKLLVESFAGLANLDCRKVSSTGLTSLIRIFLQAQETIREKVCNAKESIPIFCHMLMEFLHNLKERDDKSNVYSLTDLSRLICEENQRIDREGILASVPSDATKLHYFLSILNDRGLVLYLRGSTDEDSWIVVDEEALLSEVIEVLFAPKGFKEHHCIASNTGIATSSHITGLFPNIPPQVVIGMLKNLGFCKEIDPSHLRISNLSLEHSQGEFSLHEGEQLLFFPSHISTERPDKIWEIFQFCWYLVCQDPHQFIPERFLHVLLLKLASFLFTKHCSLSWQIDKHSCTVWKNGIRWVNENGIETVVEVLDHCTIVQMVITCPSESLMVEHCRHRSTLIREILALKQELCPSIELDEYFVLPSCLQSLNYPLPPLSKLSLLNIKSVARSAVESSECSLFIGSFDPYRNLGESLIRSLFTKGDTKVGEINLFEIAAAFEHNFQNRKNGCKVLGISFRELENRLSELPSGERENPVRVCEELLLKWKAHDADGGTYESLRHQFDMFSVFAGRNPLDLVEIEQPSLPVPLCESQQNSQSCKQ